MGGTMQFSPQKSEKPYSYNRLIIIGNGFDLASGLKTSYHDFMLWYIKEAIKKSFELGLEYHDEVINIMRSSTSHKTLKFRDYLHAINSYSQLIELAKDHHISIQPANKFTESILSDLSNLGWVDIERKYFEIIDHTSYEIDTNRAESAKLINSSLGKLAERLCDYLKLEDENHEVDYSESALSPLIDQFFSKLEKEEEELIHKSNSQQHPKETLILNFNYTNTISKLTKSYNKKRSFEIMPIHGHIDDSSPLVFGYGDDTGESYQKLENTLIDELIEKFKSHHYPNKNHYNKLLNFIHATNYEVFIVGHSIGLSDKNLLNKIFENDNCAGIKVFTHQSSENPLKTDHFSKRLAISRIFNDKTKLAGKILPETQSAYIPQEN
jgi:hypothetical protein